MNGFTFTGQELKEILISVLVLSFVFSYPEVISEPVFFLVALASVGIGFMGHELSHKYTAIRKGFFSEYRMWPQGLMLAVLLTFVSGGSLVFAAPGAVVFGAGWAFTRPTREDVGKIGLSGPLFNIAVALVFGTANMVFPFSLFRMIALVNGFLAMFNLIPFGPLDGFKVFRWSPKVWISGMALAVLGFWMAF